VAITTLPDFSLAAMQLATSSAADRVVGRTSQVGVGGSSSAAMREILRETLSFTGAYAMPVEVNISPATALDMQ
jgi:hypothetical protein